MTEQQQTQHEPDALAQDPEPKPEPKPEPAEPQSAEQEQEQEPAEPRSAPEPAPEPIAAPASDPALEPASATTPAPTPHPKKDRRVLRAALRWTAAVVVFAVCGAGTAYGITSVDRTDVPGLTTRSDGRWDYPTLLKPPLPSGRPAPLADTNKAAAHYADLRELVLPAPKGAKADTALRGKDGWLDRKVFLTEFAQDQREDLDQKLTDFGLRHIAARGWTMPDGTRARIYLLQFPTAAVAEKMMSDELTDYSSPVHPFRGAEQYLPDEAFSTVPRPKDVSVMPYVEQKPYGAEQLRLAYVSAGDTLAVVVQSRKDTTKAVPFRQTVILQGELLS